LLSVGKCSHKSQENIKRGQRGVRVPASKLWQLEKCL